MKSLLISLAVVALALLAPVFFLRDQRQRRSLVILSGLVIAVGVLAYLLSEERSRPLNLVTFMGLIGLFWVAGKFESR